MNKIFTRIRAWAADLIEPAVDWAFAFLFRVYDRATFPAYRTWTLHLAASVSVGYIFGVVFGPTGFVFGSGMAMAFYIYRGVGLTFWAWASDNADMPPSLVWPDVVGGLLGPVALFVGALLTRLA